MVPIDFLKVYFDFIFYTHYNERVKSNVLI